MALDVPILKDFRVNCMGTPLFYVIFYNGVQLL